MDVVVVVVVAYMSCTFYDSAPPMVWHHATTATKKSIGIMDQGACIYLSLH